MEDMRPTITRDFMVTITMKGIPMIDDRPRRQMERRIMLSIEGNTMIKRKEVEEITHNLVDLILQNIGDTVLDEVLNP